MVIRSNDLGPVISYLLRHILAETNFSEEVVILITGLEIVRRAEVAM